MLLSRRNFNKRAIQLMLASSISPVIFKEFQAQKSVGTPVSANTVNADPLSEAVNRQVNNILTDMNPEIELLIPTYLGNEKRRFYGRGTPEGLNLLDRFELGSGITAFRGYRTWSGAGWTGQPTITKDRGKTYLVIGAYDHSLRKIDIETNEVVWRYKYDDILKGSSTIYIDPTASEENRIVVLQGSRLGVRNSLFTSAPVPSFRAISFRTGKELWKLNIRKTASYSRDNDSSPIDLGSGVIFNAGENAIGYFLNSSTRTAAKKEGMIQPQILDEVQLYQPADIGRHSGNLVAESSPAVLKDRIYLAAGSGHIYGISIKDRKIVWDFYTGSDMDGTVAISKDEKLFCSIEKQYIPGNGGVLKLNPTKKESESVEWFFPTNNARLDDWQGGIIGSVALNDEYRTEEMPALFATCAIDGNIYIGSQNVITGKKVRGPLLDKEYNTPLIVFKQRIGGSISTPIFTDGNKLIAACYSGVYLFNLYFEPAKPDDKNALKNSKGEFYRVIVEEAARFKPEASFESTPIVWDGLIRICARDGWMYTLG
ncbi:MAG: PQQ-like beta-propeller repeat protein [Microcoleus vaginatus WJT46-NPBG5]|jgi:outer membrane protein assembly factor BamB|nr:PQQ-like beta-propeller repeat protein [Microcoleus vaginatus WJT46-NPBG5]